MTLRRVGVLMLVAVLVVVVHALVGWPRPDLAVEFAVAQRPLPAIEQATLALLCWIFVAGIAAVSVVGVRFNLARSGAGRSLALSGVMFAAGAAMLAFGIARQVDSYSVCCATPHTVLEVQQRAH